MSNKRRTVDPALDRTELERQLSADVRAMTARSDRVGRYFARANDVNNSDFHALLHIMVAETAGVPLTPAQLRQRMDLSPPAITYLVDRMIESGHIRREPDPNDRRKWLLRYEDRGMALAHDFFRPLGSRISAALADLDDDHLLAAHQVFLAMISAMATFEDELGVVDVPASARAGRATTARRAGRKTRPSPRPD
ncbi:MarR family winged helix-turn-helix transcriptional regulator [Mycolicibacterium vinylchloridicum]|uniref:MarR family winged helix-turn-helix transcriptional regulator n=1 Tax=Mycolicibacterium vinylchloridicum TaxID=2736928 RepID=UPI00389921F0